MANEMKEMLTTLAALQLAENEIRVIERGLADVDARINALNNQIGEFETRLTEGKNQLAAHKKSYREGENEVRSTDSRIDQSNAKLRSVKTNKEYQSMLKEIDDLKVKRSSIEDRMLETLELIESEEKSVETLEADFADLSAEIHEKQSEIMNNAKVRRIELEEASSERDTIFSKLDSKLQAMYVKVKNKSGGVGVAAVEDGVCQVCRMNIPPQLYIELMRMDQLIQCPSCQRLIYPKALIELD
jgi:predicted  nucleic acid-binding Zn-ribbon protein